MAQISRQSKIFIRGLELDNRGLELDKSDQNALILANYGNMINEDVAD